MIKENVKAVQGITSIYDSSEAKSFEQSANYPIAWEVLFVNNAEGKEFALKANEAFKNLPKDKGLIMDFQGDPNDVARCLECAFSNKDAFRKVLNEVLDGVSFYHEEERKIIPKMNMLNDAGKILSQKMELAV